MKKTALYIGLFAAAMISSCTKEAKQETGLTESTDGAALVRFVHASPNFRAVYNGADSFNVFVNAVKINGSTITYSSTGGVSPGGTYPSASTNNAYQSVAAGSQTFKVSLAGVLTPDSAQIATFNTTLAAGSQTTLFLTDSAKLAVSDLVAKPATGSVKVRFVDVVMNDTTGKTVDVFSARTNANIATAIKGGGVTDFVTIPYNAISDTLYIRRTGTTFVLAQANGVVFNDARSYTVYYRGNGAVATTGTKGRHVAYYLNQSSQN